MYIPNLHAVTAGRSFIAAADVMPTIISTMEIFTMHMNFHVR